ncbi:hypothetical protein ACFLY0_00030 [Patescibacteria group bacterium]
MDKETTNTNKEQTKIFGVNKHALIFAIVILVILELLWGSTFFIFSEFFIPWFVLIGISVLLSISLPWVTYHYLKKYEKLNINKPQRSYGILLGFWYLDLVHYVFKSFVYYIALFWVVEPKSILYQIIFLLIAIMFAIMLNIKLLLFSLLLRLGTIKYDGKDVEIGKSGISKKGWIVFFTIFVIIIMFSVYLLRFNMGA